MPSNTFGADITLTPEYLEDLNKISGNVQQLMTQNKETVTVSDSGRAQEYDSFPAIITGVTSLGGNRWKYSWIEHVPGTDPNTSDTTTDTRRSSKSDTDDYALAAYNAAEVNNEAVASGSGTFGSRMSYGVKGGQSVTGSGGGTGAVEVTHIETVLPVGAFGESDATSKKPMVWMTELPRLDQPFGASGGDFRFVFYAPNHVKHVINATGGGTGANQLLYQTISTDDGSCTADSTTDTLNVEHSTTNTEHKKSLSISATDTGGIDKLLFGVVPKSHIGFGANLVRLTDGDGVAGSMDIGGGSYLYYAYAAEAVIWDGLGSATTNATTEACTVWDFSRNEENITTGTGDGYDLLLDDPEPATLASVRWKAGTVLLAQKISDGVLASQRIYVTSHMPRISVDCVDP